MNTSNEQRLSSNDDLFFKDCFTEVDEGKVDAEFNNISMNCFNSKNNKFSMDSDGNLAVNSITSKESISAGYNIDLIYPIGSIYMSVNPTNPGTLFGGTWEAWGAGRTPVGINTVDDDFKTVEKTGGTKTTTHVSYKPPQNAYNSQDAGQNYLLAIQENIKTDLGITLESVVRVENNGGNIGSNGGAATEVGYYKYNVPNLQPYITCYMWKRIA